MDAETAAPPVIDLLDPEFWRSRQHEAWTWARANDPVHRDERTGIWAITRHADVLHVERHDEIFSSLRTYRLNETPTESNMIASDDPRHLQQRRLVNRGFTPRAVRDRSAEFEQMIDALVDPVTPLGRCEVVDAIAGQLPARFTCRLLGLPEDDWRRVKAWSEKLMRIDALNIDQSALAGLVEVTTELMTMVLATVPELRGCPMKDGLISQWSHAEIDGEPLSIETIFHEVGLFVAGGAETTRTAIAHPFTFDVTRSPNHHVAFGHGTHFCIGANFARRELEILFGRLTREWTDLRVLAEIDVEPNIFARAVRSFELGFTPR